MREVQFLLLIHNPDDAGSPTVEAFGRDEEAAFEALTNATLEHRDCAGAEVVLFLADSVDTLKRTHSRYFFPGPSLEEVTALVFSGDLHSAEERPTPPAFD